jgi:hypothetical protein
MPKVALSCEGQRCKCQCHINNPDEMRGELPRNKQRAIRDFAVSKRAELLAALETLKAGGEPEWIEG